MPPRQRCLLPRRHRHMLSFASPASLPSIKQAKAIVCSAALVAVQQASESRPTMLPRHRSPRLHASKWSQRPLAPPRVSLSPSRERELTSVPASAAVVAAVTRASESESRCPRASPPASSSPLRKQVEPTSVRASASVVVTVTRARADVCARLHRCCCRHHASKWSQHPRAPFRQRCCRRHVSKWSRRPRTPPPASSSPSREQVEPVSARASASVVIMQAAPHTT